MHATYNLRTGEILECSCGNALKRHVKITNFYDKKYFNTSSPNKWVFAHGKNAIKKVCEKASKNPLMSR